MMKLIIENFRKFVKEAKVIAEKRQYRKDAEYDAEQLKIGTEHELEHTDDLAQAEKIAKDHLDDDPQYYIKLRKFDID